MADEHQEFLDHLDALTAALKKARRPRRSLRRYPRPRQELSDALERARGMLAHHEPSIRTASLTDLYEYAARRFLRDTVPNPAPMAADYCHYHDHYRDWWDEWRNR